MLLSLIHLCRPKQWIKNSILFAAYVFSMGDRQVTIDSEWILLLDVVVAFFAFSLLSSAVYILNDIQDRVADRRHPVKRQRPLASGKVSPQTGYVLFVIVLAAAVGLSLLVSLEFLLIGLIYLVMFTFYSFGLKRLVILDVLFISFGFVLRAVAGGVAIDVRISGWLVICTLFLALFLVFAKRRTELASLGQDAGEHRSSLLRYNVDQLDSYLVICSCLAVVSYTLYTVSDWSTAQIGYDGILTLPFVIFGVFRYLLLVFNKEEGGDPTMLLTKDVPLLVIVVLWGVSWLYLKGYNPGILKDILVW